MPDEHAKCAEFLRHKTTLIAPGVFAQNGVRCSTLRQYAGEFVITLPKVGSPLMALDCGEFVITLPKVGSPLMALDCACSPSMALDCERTTLL